MLFKLAWRNIFRNKRRSIITVSSIIFAVIFAVFMRSLQYGAYGNMLKNIVSSYLGYIQVHKQGFWTEKTLDNSFSPEDIIGQQVTVLTNLAPRKIRGVESQGMILMTDTPDGKLAFVEPEQKVSNGQQIS